MGTGGVGIHGIHELYGSCGSLGWGEKNILQVLMCNGFQILSRYVVFQIEIVFTISMKESDFLS